MKVKSLLAILNICHDADSECIVEELTNDTMLATGHFEDLSMRSFRECTFNNVDILSDTEILISI